MNARRFNQLYKVGALFICTAESMPDGGQVVKTVGPARDFKCGCIVEINVEPYFVKVETLKSPH